MIPLTFRQLEVFTRAVEAGSFRACAEQLSISQVSVGEHIRAIEQQLGCLLFERRRGAAPVLTYQGEQVFRHAQGILSSAVDLLATFDRAPRDRMRRRIRIGAHGFIAEALAKKLAHFVTEHPQVDIELQRRSFADMLDGVALSELEVGYFLSRGPVPEVESFLAWEERLAFFAAASHPLAGRAHVDATDISGLPFAYLPARSHLRKTIDGILLDLGISDCPVALTSDDHILIAEALADGNGIACLFADWNGPFVDRGTLVKLAFSQPIPPLQIRYTVRNAYRSDRTVAGLLEALNKGK